jgi:hypothetical protein
MYYMSHKNQHIFFCLLHCALISQNKLVIQVYTDISDEVSRALRI